MAYKDTEESETKAPARMSEKQAEFLKEAKEKFKQSQEAYDDIRSNFRDDIEFYDGENHWPSEVRADRSTDGQAVLTINRMPTFVRQVTNDYRQNRPGIKVKPADDGADPDTAEILQGIVRNIEAVSHADDAYDNAFFYAVAGGMGYFRVLTDYIDDSFDQEIKIAPISNSLSVLCDPQSRAPDGSDAEWWFIEDVISKDEFKRQYPDAELIEWDDSEREDGWNEGETVRIAEYFYTEYKNDTLYLLKSGETVYKTDYDKAVDGPYIDEREAEKKTIRWCKMSGGAILEGANSKDDDGEDGLWPSQLMPIIPVYGDMLEDNGELKIFSLIRNAKDSQRMYNYYRSTETELLALQPKAPFIGVAGQFEGFEEDWQGANRTNSGYLEFNPLDINGNPAPRPERQQFAPPPSGTLQGAANAEKDMMGTIGIHEAGLGMRSNESSGKAIMARQREGDTSTYHFIDNMSKSIRRAGEVIVDLIPKIYDKPRVVRILGEDGSDQMVQINQPTTDKNKRGEEIDRIYDMGLGKYDVIIASGANYASRREEAKEGIATVLQGNPNLWNIAGDLLVEAMDWPNADDLADRMRKMLPPELKPPEEGEPPQLPPEVMQQIQQGQQQVEQMGQVIEKMSGELEVKEAEMLKQQNDAAALQIKQFEAETKRMSAERDVGSGGLTEEEKIQHESEMKVLIEQMKIDAAERMAMLNAKIELAKANKDEMVEYDEMGEALPSQLAQQITGMQDFLVNQASTLNDLHSKVSAPKPPKVIVRDDDGNIVGIQQGEDMRGLRRNENGDIEGLE